MNEYKYEGPVMIFGKCVTSIWKASTMAISEKEARSNLAYQYKKVNNLVPSSKVEPPGTLILY